LSRSELTAELVIPSFNRLGVLKKTMEQVRLLYPKLKICLGLQGEMPDAKWQAELEKDIFLRIERLSAPSTTATLNHCIFSSQADIILILDDDAIPHFGWLESHMDAFLNNADLVYTSGRVVEFARWRSAFSEWFRIIVEWVAGTFLDQDKKINGRITGWFNWIGLSFTNQHLPGSCKINSPREGNMGIRRSSFVATKGFNNTFVGNAWGFGADFGLRMAKQGKYGRYLGGAIIIHHEVPYGGTRQLDNRQWFKDFIFNQKIVINNLGPQAWLGALPRIAKKLLWLIMNK
jgi:GT2 family glycosyltransferase